MKNKFKVKKNSYLLKRFPFKNYKIAQISDLHLGFYTKKGIVRHLVDTILANKSNLVVITGDLIEGDIFELLQELKEFRNLTRKVDTYFVFGNHDFQYNLGDKVIDILKSLDIKILINESVWIGDNHKGFNLIGVADPIAVIHKYPDKYFPNIEKSLQNINKDFPTILLSHRSIRRYMEIEFSIDLMLSGHIHGGQIFPFGYLILILKEDSGEKLYLRTQKIDKSRYVNISKGLGVTRLPLRFLVPRELNLITINPV